MATNFHIAPPAKTVDGLLAVPMDIQSIDGSFLFNAGTSVATADVTISYTVGPTAGNPIFDLRQPITEAWLDGAVFPPAQLASHSFGAGMFDTLRVIESVQAAGSVHTLRVKYTMGIPNSQLIGYLPALEWLAGPSLKFVFGLSDLRAARYAEAWLPANLPFDQYSINLEIQITNTMAAHSVITNATITTLGANHWSLAFPSRFSSVSPLLEIRASSTLESLSGSVMLPVSGNVVTIETWKPAGDVTNLATQITSIGNFLSDNENDYGAYVHGNRFVAFFNGGGMEYEGGTTTSVSALNHETFHSWFARGMKPAGQADGWWDEGFTQYHDNGANDAIPFDFTDTPVTLCSRNPWQRTTPGNSYGDGAAFFSGIASLISVPTFNNLMGQLYTQYKGKSPVSTAMMEEFLVSRSGNAQIVDGFHRFVYGFSDGTAPELWMKDDTAHTGADEWDGAFWDSPDLWIRHADDDGTVHQSPEFGQDNWFYARVRNKNTAGEAKHFVCTFNYKEWAGTEFLYPGDFLPSVAAKAEFELGPGETRIVKAKWPRASVPAAGTHACILAAVLARQDHPVSNKHVWEHNNLAQKNATVVDLSPNWFIIIPVVLLNISGESSAYTLEVWRDKKFSKYPVSVVHKNKEFFRQNPKMKLKLLQDALVQNNQQHDYHQHAERDCGGHLHGHDFTAKDLLLSNRPDLIAKRFPGAFEGAFGDAQSASMKIDLPRNSPLVAGLKINVPADVKRGTTFKTHLVQRNVKTKQVTGGITVTVRVTGERSLSVKG
jgi:hypothetical protein